MTKGSITMLLIQFFSSSWLILIFQFRIKMRSHLWTSRLTMKPFFLQNSNPQQQKAEDLFNQFPIDSIQPGESLTGTTNCSGFYQAVPNIFESNSKTPNYWARTANISHMILLWHFNKTPILFQLQDAQSPPENRFDHSFYNNSDQFLTYPSSSDCQVLPLC